jgi:16S rRNA (guanine527-N7)-methyltransferase
MNGLKEKAAAGGITLSDNELNVFQKFYHELQSWNERISLTAITKEDEIITKHFLDSLSVTQALPHNASTLIDIGSGAGFPGIPIAIVRPQCTITLLESVAKKAAFLRHVKEVLELSNITVIHARAEDVAHDPLHRERYDCAVARAVAFLPTLLEYALPFVHAGGIFIAQKIYNDEEVSASKNALEKLGGSIKEIVPIQIERLEERHLIVVEKKKSTPEEYPRRTGTPSHKPL